MRHVIKDVPFTGSRSKSRGAVGVMGMATVVALLVMATGASAAFGFSEFKTNKWPVSVTGKGGALTLEAEGGGKVTCEKSSMAGMFTSFTLLKIALTLSGKCEVKDTLFGEFPTCTEPIKSEELDLSPGEISGGSKRGLLFKPASGEVVAKLECHGQKFTTKATVKGALVCENPHPGKLSTTLEIVCADAAPAEQLYTSINVGGTLLSKQELKAEATDLLKITEKDALATTEVVTFGAEVEQT